ncbi:unnamed protein product [Periconia digitata]|uniref:Uncharacterized protein n=1 Tax=Periconia digitata TaxID=1303443 RepID=A0A9W4UKT0_9PLEO|nr:unnamed protein product [Periconia digitata]
MDGHHGSQNIDRILHPLLGHSPIVTHKLWGHKNLSIGQHPPLHRNNSRHTIVSPCGHFALSSRTALTASTDAYSLWFMSFANSLA